MTAINYRDIMRNKHFVLLTAIIRVARMHSDWRKDSKVIFYEDQFSKLVFMDATNRDEIVKSFCNLIVEITTHDPFLLFYTEDDMKWFISLMDMENTNQLRAILSLFCATYTCDDTYLTPSEVAEMTDTAESGWRNKAANMKIPGCIKKGKQWLLPVSVLKATGVIDWDWRQ